MPNLNRFPSVLLITLSLSLCRGEPASGGRPAEQSARIDELLAPWSGKTPGAAVLVTQAGQILHRKGYGLADIDDERPIQPDTTFLLASVTKQFTAMAIMILAERGRLAYEDPLSKFFPAFPSYARKITIRHLLNHSSGLPDYEQLFVKAQMIDTHWPRSSWESPSFFEPTARDALTLLSRQKKLRFSPGQRWEYSNSGYVVLAQIVEKLSGGRFAEFLKHNIFEPLGMDHSHVFDERRPEIPNRAHSYRREGAGYREIDYSPLNLIYGEDNVVSSIDDLHKWNQALDSPKLVKTETLKEAFTSGTLPNGTPTGYGFGWEVGRDSTLEYRRHAGAWLGFRTFILHYPAERLTAIMLSNLAEFPQKDIANQIAKLFLE